MRWEIGDGNPNSLLHLRAVNLCVGGVFMKPPELVPIFLGTFFAMNPSWVLDERIWDWKFGVFLLWFSIFFFWWVSCWVCFHFGSESHFG